MRKMTRTGLLGTAGIGAVALAVTGIALPANADDQTWSSDETHVSTTAFESVDAFQAWVHDVIEANGNETTAGNVGVDGGLINGPLVSDVANGPILSGNDAPVASGNDVQAPVASGNDTTVDAPVGNGNHVGSGNQAGNGNEVSTSPNVGSGNHTGASLSDIGADVDDVTSDIGAEVGDVVSDVTGEVDDLVGGLLD